MHYIRDKVIVLRKIPYREFDRRYIMYGQKHGLLIAVARGSMKIGAKQAGQLEPLTIAEVMIAKGRNYDHLAVAMRKNSEFTLNKLGTLAIAGAFADLYLKLIRPGVADERLFLLWEDLFNCLAQIKIEPTSLRAELLFAAASLRLMDALGYGPALRSCALCHKPPGPTDAWYATNMNALICTDCAVGWPDRKFAAKAHALALLRFMREAGLDEILRVSLNSDIAQNAINIIQEVWQHAPLDRKPHGLETIESILAV